MNQSFVTRNFTIRVSILTGQINTLALTDRDRLFLHCESSHIINVDVTWEHNVFREKQNNILS